MGLVLLAGGCGREAGRLDRREENHPLLRRAQARKRANDIDGAVRLYQEALERRPDLVRAHLELGLLYDQPKDDYVRAIYHYERYLERRPDAEKRDLVEDLIRHAKLSFAASLPDKPSGAIQRIADLEEENARLRALLEPGRGAGAAAPAAAARPAGAPAGALTPPAPAPAAPAVVTYRVQNGDTLSSIAKKLYDDPNQWQRIYEANRSILPNPGSVRPGQTLAVPRLEP